AFLFSLPVTRREYVLEKYLFGIILGGGACVIALLLITVLGMLKGTVPSADTLLITCMVFATLLGLLALLLPFQLKFGGEKGRIALIASLAMAFILVSIIVSGLKAVQFDLISNISVMPLHGMVTSAVAI